MTGWEEGGGRAQKRSWEGGSEEKGKSWEEEGDDRDSDKGQKE